MLDDWEDWEDKDYIVPILNEEQLKILEERKLVEESDNALTKHLFSNEDVISQDRISQDRISQDRKTKQEPLQKVKISNQYQNELKQKEISRIIKQQKLEKQREIELYGENEYYDEYAEYEDKFN